jgi:ketosteroid isomerase-like protein
LSFYGLHVTSNPTFYAGLTTPQTLNTGAEKYAIKTSGAKGSNMSNLNRIKAVYDAFAKGDIMSVLEVFSAAIDWTEAEGFPYGGTYHGPKAVLEGVFMRLGAEWEGFAAVPHEFIDGGDTIVALGKYSGTYKATGKSFQAEFAHVWKLSEGKAVRFVQYVDTLLVHRAVSV